MATKILFDLKVKLIDKPYKDNYIFTRFTGEVYVVENIIKKLKKTTLEFAMKHEEYHHKVNRLIFLLLPIDICLLLIFSIIYYISKTIWILKLVGAFSLLLFPIVLIILTLFVLEVVGIEEKMADKYAVKNLNKKRAKAAILELYKRHVIKEDQVHGSIKSRLAYIDSIK